MENSRLCVTIFLKPNIVLVSNTETTQLKYFFLIERRRTFFFLEIECAKPLVISPPLLIFTFPQFVSDKQGILGVLSTIMVHVDS